MKDEGIFSYFIYFSSLFAWISKMKTLFLQTNKIKIPSMKQLYSLTMSEVSTPRKRRLFALLLLLLALLMPALTQAQEMRVKGMALDPNDVTANLSENLILDNNDAYAGLVKVYLAAANAEFEGLVLKSILHGAGEYWVFMAKDSYRLRVRVPGYLPLELNFRDYGIKGIDSRRTYVLTITLPQVGAVQQDDGMRYLAMTVEPKNSTVFVDGQLQQVDANGELSVILPKGTHGYQVLAPGYATKEGSVEVGDDNRPLSVKLVSTLSTVRVECATKGAQVFINNQQRGLVPWTGSLAPGIYQVEARLDGYRPQKQTVTLGESDNKVITIPELQMISGRLNVDFRPLGSDVYIDGKKIGTTPFIFRNILIGQHRVEIRKEGYETKTQTVTIKENEQTSLTGSLTALSTSAPQSSAASNSASSSSSDKEVFTVNGVSFTMIRVEGGTFTMGATAEQGSDAYDSEKPAHEVTLSSYMISETEVTQALWQALMGNNPSKFSDNPQNPVEEVSWDDCQEFVKKLNSLTGKSFRLPTEAEWEYAARGGSKSKHYKYSGSNSLDDVAWCSDNYGGKTHPVKGKSPNELGLYDMSGNVWEWCVDWYDREYYKSSPKSSPKGPSTGSLRVLRGGGWNRNAWSCRVSYRDSHIPSHRGSYRGFRLAQ